MSKIHLSRRLIAASSACWLALLLPTTARAQEWVEAYAYDFEAVQVGSFSGVDGWIAGWDQDPWTTNAYPGEVNPITDEGGGQWSASSATANHLVQTDAGSWADAAFEAQAAIYDNDTLGLVLRKSDDATFYLFFMTTDRAPALGGGGDAVSLSGSYLYRVEGGIAVLAAANENARYVQDQGQVDYQRLRIEAVGGAVTAYYSDQESGSWSVAEVVLEYTDDDPLPAGAFGLYSYEMGSNSALVGFRAPALQLLDEDGDGWVNDEDCQPDDAASNPDAAEDCDDGVDNDCDGAADGADTDCGGDDDDDTADDDDDDDDDTAGDDDTGGDDDTAGDDDGDDDDNDFVLVGGENGCACGLDRGPGGKNAAMAAGLALLALTRRRRP
jgi:MYXO-CTERM domain-containing protein